MMSDESGKRLGGGCGRQGNGSVGDGRLAKPTNGDGDEAAAGPLSSPKGDEDDDDDGNLNGDGDDGNPNGDGDGGNLNGDGDDGGGGELTVPCHW